MGRQRLRTTEGDEVVVEAADRVRVGDRAFTVEAAGAGAWRVTDPNGRARVVHAVSTPDGCWVHVDGMVHVALLDDGSQHRRSRAAGTEDALAAPMPATVLSIAAPAGTSVRAGDVLLLLEAMKMELPIRAPRDGTVSAVHCRPGELVQPGVTLVEIA